MRARRNGDEELRRLEREALAGDLHALNALLVAAQRRQDKRLAGVVEDVVAKRLMDLGQGFHGGIYGTARDQNDLYLATRELGWRAWEMDRPLFFARYIRDPGVAALERLLGHKNPSDSDEWLEIERASAAESTGGGAERSAAEWRAQTYPIFGADEVANRLLQVLDSLGGEGVRFSARSVASEFPKHRTVIRTRLGAAIQKLEQRGYVRAVPSLSDAERGRLSLPIPTRKGTSREWTTAFEFTLLGHQAALASRVIPAEIEAQAVAARLAPEVGVGAYPRLWSKETHEGDPMAFEREVTARGLATTRPELPPQFRPGTDDELAAPWRSFRRRSERMAGGYSPFALASGQTVAFSTEIQGGFLVFRAWDDSSYMFDRPLLVGELWLRLSASDPYWPSPPHSVATVVWAWVHPEWSDPDTFFVLRHLHELAAQEAERRGLALASAVERTPQVDRFWRRQVGKKRARSVSRPGTAGFDASRFYLDYPPPATLENPRKRNVDEETRRLLRAIEEKPGDEVLTMKLAAVALRYGDQDLAQEVFRQAQIRIQRAYEAAAPLGYGTASRVVAWLEHGRAEIDLHKLADQLKPLWDPELKFPVGARVANLVTGLRGTVVDASRSSDRVTVLWDDGVQTRPDVLVLGKAGTPPPSCRHEPGTCRYGGL